MLTFLFLLILIAGILQVISLGDGLDHIDFNYKAGVREAEPGASFNVEASIRNRWFLPISYLKTRLLFPRSFILPEDAKTEEGSHNRSLEYISRVGPKEMLKTTFPVSCEKRGFHHLSGALLERGDFLGTSETSRQFYSRSAVLIYPSPYPVKEIDDTLGSLYGEMTTNRFLIRDPVLTLNCREYTGQEPMHTISWTQTARLGEIMVREFEPTRQLSCSIVLYNEGLKADEEDLLDLCCSLARTAGEYMIDRGVFISFFTNSAMSGFTGNSIRHIKSGKENLKDYLAMLASLLIHRAGSKEALAEALMGSHDGTDSILIISPKNTEGLSSFISSVERLTSATPKIFIAEEMDLAEGKEEAYVS